MSAFPHRGFCFLIRAKTLRRDSSFPRGWESSVRFSASHRRYALPALDSRLRGNDGAKAQDQNWRFRLGSTRGVGSRFRSTTMLSGSSLTEIDSRPLGFIRNTNLTRQFWCCALVCKFTPTGFHLLAQGGRVCGHPGKCMRRTMHTPTGFNQRSSPI